MKKILLILFSFFAINYAKADCAMSAMSFFPTNQNNISTNSIFIIQGYGMSMSTVESFKNRKIYLETESGELIELKLKEILTGKGQNQAVFFPNIKLHNKTKYRIKYSDETEFETRELSKWDSSTKNYKKITWETASDDISSMLNDNIIFSFLKTESKMYGCGPSSNAIFEINSPSDSEIIYRTELLDLATNKISIFYVFAQKNRLQVGYGMCSGDFKLKENSNYKVRFTPTDATGKTAKASRWRTFKSAKISRF